MSVLFAAVEDDVSFSVVERLAQCLCRNLTDVRKLGRSQGGYGSVRSKLGKYVNLANRERVLILTDLDLKECPPTLRADWLSANNLADPLPERLAFCVAVREVEAWLIADREGMANFLQISVNLIDRDVEYVKIDPKKYLLELTKRSPSRDLKRDMLPDRAGGAKVGIGYNPKVQAYVRQCWCPERGAENSKSLQRAMSRLVSLDG